MSRARPLPFSPFLGFRELVVAAPEPGVAVARWAEIFGVRAEVGDRAVWLGDARLRFEAGARGGVTRVAVEVGDPDAVAAAAERGGAARYRSTRGTQVVSVSGAVIELLAPARDARPAPTPGLVDRIHHVVVAVADEPAALAAWRAAFDFRPAPEGPEGFLAPHHVPVGDAWFGVTSRGTDARALARFVERRGEGVYAIALVVADRADAVARVTDAGAEVVGDVRDHQVFVHPRSTHGVLLELVEEWPGGIRRPG